MSFKVYSTQILWLFAICFIVCCSSQANNYNDIIVFPDDLPVVISKIRDQNKPDPQSFNKGLESFGKRLYSELERTYNKKTNIIFSPLSVETCLAMTRIGAEHQTAIEIGQGLQLSNQEPDDLANNFYTLLKPYENGAHLKIANRIYVKPDVKVRKQFTNTLKNKFFSSVGAVNFANSNSAARVINHWVRNKTNNRIKKIIPAYLLNNDTRLVLVNAIHFNGEWVNQFEERDTYQENFFVDNTNAVKVQMMFTSGDFLYGEFPDLDATALEMPYKDSDLSMLIILPNSRNGLKRLEEKLKSIQLSNLTENMFEENIKVRVPKFKVEFEVELSNILKNLGMKRMFTDSAEFRKISDGDLKVSAVVHKAFIEVNENGTEAAAASGVLLPILLMGVHAEFTANRPFIYYIKNSKNFIIFSGNVKSF